MVFYDRFQVQTMDAKFDRHTRQDVVACRKFFVYFFVCKKVTLMRPLGELNPCCGNENPES